MKDATKKKVLGHLRRISRQVGAIAAMVDGDHHCVDVLRQIASVQAALVEAGELVLRSHVATCVTDVLASGRAAERKRKVDELMEVFSRIRCPGGRE